MSGKEEGSSSLKQLKNFIWFLTTCPIHAEFSIQLAGFCLLMYVCLFVYFANIHCMFTKCQILFHVFEIIILINPHSNSES